MRSRSRLIAAALIGCLALPAQLPAEAAAAPAPAAVASPLAALIPDAQALSAAAAGLPADPGRAAEQLVDKVFGPDDRIAVAATGELLRRAGLPLVSAAGPVVAMPAGLAVISTPVDVELLPGLTRSVRSGTEYTPLQLAQTLTYLGTASGNPMTGTDVVHVLAQWGKDAAAPAESVTAGAAVRALARARGQLLVPAAMVDQATLALVAGHAQSPSRQQASALNAPGRLTGVDPLTFVLMVAHTAGLVTDHPQVVPAGQGLRGAAPGPCSELKAMPDEGKAVVKKQLRDDVKIAAGQVAKNVDEEALGHVFDQAFDGYDKGTDVVATALLLAGARLDLVASPPTTHFRHESGDTSKDVWFVAQATFDGPLAQQRLDCWALAGIEVPPDGPLNGYRVRWEIFNGLPVLQAKKSDTDKVLHGSLTQQGVATLMMFPRTEARPPRPGESVPEKFTENLVIASLDKDDFPFKLSDLVGLADGVGPAALSKAWDIAVAWMQKIGLPSRRLRYQVSFHAGDPYVITSHTTMEIFGFASVGLDADLYSCTGPGGPWKGTVTLSGSAEAILQYVGKMVGAKGATSGSVDFPMNFTLNPGSSQAQHVPFGKDLGLTIALDPDRVDEVEHPQSTNDNWDLLTGNAVVGEGSYLSGGVDLRELGSSAAAGMVQNPEYAVVAAIRDSRCPGSSYWDDRFDDD